MKKLKVNYKDSVEKQLKELGIISYMNLSEITDLYPPSSDGYIYDVEDGKAMCGKSVNECEIEFRKQGRRGLTVKEVLAIYRHSPKVLKDHHIDCSGSRCGSGGAPILYVFGDRPGLCWRYLGSSDGQWGAASCGSRTLDLGNSGLLEIRILELEKFRDKVEKVLKL